VEARVARPAAHNFSSDAYNSCSYELTAVVCRQVPRLFLASYFGSLI